MKKLIFRQHLHETLCLLFRITMIPWFLREIYARRKVTTINYHNPKPELFEQHLRFYIRNYSIISMDQLTTSLSTGNWASLPPKSLVITFDDGYAGNRFLFDILKKYQIPTIMYIVAGVINTNRKFWFNVIPPQSQTITSLESMEDSVRRSTLEHTCSHTDRREYEDRDAPTAEEIHKFIAAGGTVGAHTMFHPILTKCSEETAIFELKESKKVLEQFFKCNVSHFAYPRGAWNNTVRNSVGTAGFVSARATTSEWVTPKSDIFVLPSFGISDDAGLNKAIVQASGLWDLLKKLAHRR